VLLSLQEFLALREPEDGTKFELDEGTLLCLPQTGAAHAYRLDRTYRYLIAHLPESEYDILPGEVGFILGYDPKPIVRGADLAVMPHRDQHNQQLLRTPALLIVEVLSPANTSEDIERKRQQYLHHGVQELWIVYEKSRTMHVWQRSAEAASEQDYKLLVAGRESRFESSLGFPVELERIFA
jgi:Uma2 family endonuclease